MEKYMQWIWLGLGVLLAAMGGAMKASEVMAEPGAFDYVFFRGSNYVIMIAGLCLILAGLSHDLLFGDETAMDGSGSAR